MQWHTCCCASEKDSLSTTRNVPETTIKTKKTRRALGRMHLPPTKVFPRLAVKKNHFKTMPRCSDGRPIPIRGFSRHNKIPRCSAYDIGEAIRHPDYNPDWAQKLISSSMCRHLSTRNISSKSMHTFLSNLANRQTDRQTMRANAFTSSFVGNN